MLALHNAVTNNVTYSLIDESNNTIEDSIGMSINTSAGELTVDTSILINQTYVVKMVYEGSEYFTSPFDVKV